ncbi:twin-arginine translocation signal domain-containing protein [Anaerophaga thermohalophila]|jgi:hypothetical protein|uniref:twin-arginine translocation signal domain-containing protein n=1 Tax=Anaerophaga thermohalophila TaxID=177400 RepID=UPI0003083CC5|nr:twin-arginine translocation signal domain-containing protein [Anaerophaga thermohalophila]
MNRRTFLKNAGIAGGLMAMPSLWSCNASGEKFDFPLTDLHVHLTRDFTIDHLMELSEKRGVRFGVVEHPADWAIKDDADLKAYINKLRQYPVYVGLQPMTPNWTKRFSPDLLKSLDYILMDPQTIPLGRGRFQRIYELSCYVEDTDEFMRRYMDYTISVLENEPLNIFGWPLFLPVCIARDYYKLWTQERMQKIISAAKASNIAIEINDMSHTPHKEFILMCKEQGLKFTFGSDSRNMNAGRLAYCKRVANECGLAKEDFYVPGKGDVVV